MDKCEYQYFFENDTNIKIKKNETMNDKTWKPLLRQCMISIGVWCVYLLQGLYLGTPTVMIAQIRRDGNSTEIITDEMLSWITSLPVISGTPFVIMLPWLFNKIGRKFCFVILWLFLIIGNIIFYISTNLYYVLISEVFMGANTAAVITFAPVLITEYTSPKYRGTLLTLKSATTFWGLWIANAIGTFFHWKNIALVSVIGPVYILTVFFWPESPYWLAIKGRYEESIKSHRWLKGVNKNSEKELTQLINYAKDELQLRCTNKIRSRSKFLELWSTITSRSFYKPTLICLLLHAQYLFSGKVMISMYAIQALKHLVVEESVAYKHMLILDGVSVFSMYVGCILSRYFKRRTLMLTFSFSGILLLYMLSFYVYLVHLGIFQENHLIIILLLSAYSIAIGCGPMILSTSLCAEIIPFRYQYTSMTCIGLGSITAMSFLLKISPFMFINLKMYGTFLFFAVSSTVIMIFLYFQLPETKDKTVQEIETYFNANKVYDTK